MGIEKKKNKIKLKKFIVNLSLTEYLYNQLVFNYQFVLINLNTVKITFFNLNISKREKK